MSHTVVFPDAVPPHTPITNGCLGAGDASPLGASAAPLQVAEEGEEGREEEEERRRKSRRRPLKWAPTAESRTSSIGELRGRGCGRRRGRGRGELAIAVASSEVLTRGWGGFWVGEGGQGRGGGERRTLRGAGFACTP